MKTNEVVIGDEYGVKVSGKMTIVKILSEASDGGWNGLNRTTGRLVVIKTAARLRYQITPPPATPKKETIAMNCSECMIVPYKKIIDPETSSAKYSFYCPACEKTHTPSINVLVAVALWNDQNTPADDPTPPKETKPKDSPVVKANHVIHLSGTHEYVKTEISEIVNGKIKRELAFTEDFDEAARYSSAVAEMCIERYQDIDLEAIPMAEVTVATKYCKNCGIRPVDFNWDFCSEKCKDAYEELALEDAPLNQEGCEKDGQTAAAVLHSSQTKTNHWSGLTVDTLDTDALLELAKMIKAELDSRNAAVPGFEIDLTELSRDELRQLRRDAYNEITGRSTPR